VVVAVVDFLPVLLLPLTTSVPLWAWLPQLVLGVAALVWLVVGRRRRWVRPAAVGVNGSEQWITIRAP
jgi:apolipoprotein N-acyltransferase